MNSQIIDARREDAPFLGWVMQTASRSHLDRGFLDIFIDASDEECVQFLEMLSLTEARHWANYENFIVVKSENQQLGALCGYFVEDQEGPILAKGAVEVAVQLGWSHDQLVAAWQRVSANSLVSIDRVPGAWVVESVAVLPEFRRRGWWANCSRRSLTEGESAALPTRRSACSSAMTLHNARTRKLASRLSVKFEMPSTKRHSIRLASASYGDLFESCRVPFQIGAVTIVPSCGLVCHSRKSRAGVDSRIARRNR
jgi:hypothetical protein